MYALVIGSPRCHHVGCRHLVSPRRCGSRPGFLHPDVAALAKLAIVDSSSLRSFVGKLAGNSGKLLARFVAPPAHADSDSRQESKYTSKIIPQFQEMSGASTSVVLRSSR